MTALTFDESVEHYLAWANSQPGMNPIPSSEYLSYLAGVEWHLTNVNGPIAVVSPDGTVSPPSSDAKCEQESLMRWGRTVNAAIEYLGYLLDHYEAMGYCRPTKVRTVGAAIEFENLEAPHLECLYDSMLDRYSEEQLLEAREFVLPRTDEDEVDWEAIEKEVGRATIEKGELARPRLVK